MQLRSLVSDSEVVVYREKWGTLFMGLVTGLVCIGFGLGFYALVAEQAKDSRFFLGIFCAAFVLVGIAILWRLPNQAVHMFAENGLRVLTANQTGLSISSLPGAPTQPLAWEGIQEILLAERLVLVDPDETTHTWRMVVIFVADDQLSGRGWLDRLQNAVSRSGEGRPYLLCDYSAGDGEKLATGLRRLAPGHVSIRFRQRAKFDLKAGVDTFSE
ncbi:MAG: hypothetical protein SF172_13500 [Burkholderiales bacterium]|nr:hypothetical protein [Burkholderiales bacterium]